MIFPYRSFMNYMSYFFKTVTHKTPKDSYSPFNKILSVCWFLQMLTIQINSQTKLLPSNIKTTIRCFDFVSRFNLQQKDFIDAFTILFAFDSKTHPDHTIFYQPAFDTSTLDAGLRTPTVGTRFKLYVFFVSREKNFYENIGQMDARGQTGPKGPLLISLWAIFCLFMIVITNRICPVFYSQTGAKFQHTTDIRHHRCGAEAFRRISARSSEGFTATDFLLNFERSKEIKKFVLPPCPCHSTLRNDKKDSWKKGSLSVYLLVSPWDTILVNRIKLKCQEREKSTFGEKNIKLFKLWFGNIWRVKTV